MSAWAVVVVIAALCVAGAVLWLLGLAWNAPVWCAVMGAAVLAIVAIWRRAWRVPAPGGDRGGDWP